MPQPADVGASIGRDAGSMMKAVTSIKAIVGNDDTEGTGAAVDLKGYEGAFALAYVGISADTLSGSVKIFPKLQESADGSTGWVDIPAASMNVLQGALTALTEIDDPAEDDVLIQVSIRGGQRLRYVRWFFDFTGTHTNGTPIFAAIIKTHPRVAPATM